MSGDRTTLAAAVRRWLSPGIGIKRWLVVVFAGELLLALAAAHTIRQATRDLQPGGPMQVVIDAVTLQFLPYPLRGALVGAAGLLLIALGVVRVVRAVTDPLRSDDGSQPLVEVIYQKRFLARGPRIVAIGGGTGLSTLLRGLKEHTSNLTAIVAMADDGGSSGILRGELGIPPVGDIRNCIVALADAEPLMGRLLQYRFPDGSSQALAGHPVGNLLLAALMAIEAGDVEEGIRQANRVLAVRGRVVPATARPLTLHARLADGTEVAGQSRIGRLAGIERVWISPPDAEPTDDALTAIGDADVIVVGPGSLYTSILPCLLLGAVRDAIVDSPATRIYVANVATQHGETDEYDLVRHVEALEAHTRPGLVDVVLANNRFDAPVPAGSGEAVRLTWPPAGPRPARLVLEDVVDPENAHFHDPARLAAAILRTATQEAGARRRGAARTA